MGNTQKFEIKIYQEKCQKLVYVYACKTIDNISDYRTQQIWCKYDVNFLVISAKSRTKHVKIYFGTDLGSTYNYLIHQFLSLQLNSIEL